MSTITTIAGWVGSNPALSVAKNGTQFTTIRVATTNRYRNANQEWVDGETQWFGVRLFGDFAENSVTSVRRGDPVVVTGRFALEEWENEERSGASLLLYATAMGHDLSRGRTAFTRVIRGQDAPVARAAVQGEQATASAPETTTNGFSSAVDVTEFETLSDTEGDQEEADNTSVAMTA